MSLSLCIRAAYVSHEADDRIPEWKFLSIPPTHLHLYTATSKIRCNYAMRQCQTTHMEKQTAMADWWWRWCTWYSDGRKDAYRYTNRVDRSQFNCAGETRWAFGPWGGDLKYGNWSTSRIGQRSRISSGWQQGPILQHWGTNRSTTGWKMEGSNFLHAGICILCWSSASGSPIKGSPPS